MLLFLHSDVFKEDEMNMKVTAPRKAKTSYKIQLIDYTFFSNVKNMIDNTLVPV